MPSNQGEFIRLDCPRCGSPLQGEGNVLTCQYCGGRVMLQHAPGHQGAGAAGGTRVGGFNLQPFSYNDPQAGTEAFSLLVPQGWQASGGVTWVIERPAAPVQIGFQVANPGGPEAFEVFPTLYFTWTSNPLTQMTKPPGSLHFGYEVRQPVPASQAMHQFVLPRYRRIPGLVVADEGPNEELRQVVSRNQQAQAQGGQYSNDAHRVRLHYAVSGQAVAEELSGVAEYTRVVFPGAFGAAEDVYWSMGTLTSFRGARERTEGYADLYRAMLGSFKVNPGWLGVVGQVSQGLIGNQIRHINQIGTISRQIARNSEEMRAQNLAGWQARSDAQDRESELFSQVIRGVDPYYDPNLGRMVELPSGYTQAWCNPLGEYILSDDPNFNPNIGDNRTWSPMSPPQKG